MDTGSLEAVGQHMGKGQAVRSPGTRPLPTDYPWRWSQAIPMNSVLIKWLYLPDFFMAPNSTNLISECPQAGPLVHMRHPPPVSLTEGQGGSARAAMEGRVAHALPAGPMLWFPGRMGVGVGWDPFHGCASSCRIVPWH